MENPYWHPFVKPHSVDLDEVRANCFRAFCIVKASSALEGATPEFLNGIVYEQFFRSAEEQLNIHLLDIAIRLRTFDDVMKIDEENSEYKAAIEAFEKENDIGLFYYKSNEQNPVAITFRSACNRIIHASDLRYVYDNGANEVSEDLAWGMTGFLELSGKEQSKQWEAVLSIDEFLSVCLGICDRFTIFDGGEV